MRFYFTYITSFAGTSVATFHLINPVYWVFVTDVCCYIGCESIKIFYLEMTLSVGLHKVLEYLGIGWGTINYLWGK